MSQTKDHERQGQKKKIPRDCSKAAMTKDHPHHLKNHKKKPDHLTLTLTKDWEMPKCPKKNSDR